jgi:hypothetical protein
MGVMEGLALSALPIRQSSANTMLRELFDWFVELWQNELNADRSKS